MDILTGAVVDLLILEYNIHNTVNQDYIHWLGSNGFQNDGSSRLIYYCIYYYEITPYVDDEDGWTEYIEVTSECFAWGGNFYSKS